MKTKTLVIGFILTGMVSGPLMAQVDTSGKKKDTAWKSQRDTMNRRTDTAWKPKRDSNQVNLNSYYRQKQKVPGESDRYNCGVAIAKILSRDMLRASDRWFVRKYKNEEWKQELA